MQKKSHLDEKDITADQVWAISLFGNASLPDIRLNMRLVNVASKLASKPTSSIPQTFKTWSEIKGAYRFIENERVKVSMLEKSVSNATAKKCIGEDTILSIQDTTALSFSNLKGTEGLGPINDSPNARGIFVHSALAVQENGVPIGLLNQQFWCRDPEEKGKSKNRRLKPIEEKESYKWIVGIEESRNAIRSQIPKEKRPRIIHVTDREGDIHEVLQIIVESDDGAVIRCYHNRRVEGEIEAAHKAVRDSLVIGEVMIDVPRKKGQRARKATVHLRGRKVTLKAHKKNLSKHKKIKINLLEVYEANPPDGVEPLHWLLWTTEEVERPESALRVLEIYKKRWQIEEVHLVLKSGCKIEELQMDTAERLMKMIALYLPVAVRIVQLRTLARQEPEAPCTLVLSDCEWQALWIAIAKKPLPKGIMIPTIRQAVLWIGQLGGHIGRKRDGMPGVRTLWLGWRDLQLLTEFYRANSPPA